MRRMRRTFSTSFLLATFFFNCMTASVESRDPKMALDPKIKAASHEDITGLCPGNPSITIYDETVKVNWGKHREKVKELQPEEVEKYLVSLPVSAWPLGRIIVLSYCGISSGTEKTQKYRKRSWGVIVDVMKRLKVVVNPVPSA